MQLPLVALEVPPVVERVRPGRKPRANGTVLSEADQERIRKLIEERDRLPSGLKYRKLRMNIGCRIWNIRNPDWKADPQKRKASQERWLVKNRHRRQAISLASYYRCRPPLQERTLPETEIAVYLRKRRLTNVQFMLAERLRATIRRAFRRNWIEKPYRTEALLGCTIAEAKSHIERQFVNGMSWEHRASFVIDHLVPVAAFDLRDAEEVKLAFNWRNLQPITQHENAVKSDTLPTPLPSWLPAHVADRLTRRMGAK